MANYQRIARQSAVRYGLDPNVFGRQIRQESGYNPNAVSPAGARGIAQFMPGTAKGLGINPDNPVQALDAAAKLMAGYVKKYGSYKDALVAYNAGPGRVGGALPAETQNYVNTILGGRTPAAPKAAPQAYAANTGTDSRRQMALSLIGFGNLGGSSYGASDPLTTALLKAAQGAQQAPASGGYGPASVPAGSIYSKKNLGRTDMGVDFTGKGAIPALGDAVVTRVQGQNTGTGWPGQGDAGRGSRGAIVVYRLTSGPAKGKFVYVAENLDPHVRVGQRVRAGQAIATARGSFPYTETGWAADAHGRTLASATTGYREGQQTQAGKSFRQFLNL